MSSEIPPTYYFDNISFNPDFYQSSSDDYLTATTGKKIFLSYPYAQGTESISKIFSSNIDSLTPTSTFSFLDTQTAGINIGDSVVGTIKIGQNTGTSIHCGSIDCAGTNINNSVSPLIGNLSLVPSQTSGVLNIGTGARTTDGIINIGTGSTLANPINIGSASSISSLNGTVNVATIITTPKIDSTTATTDMFIGSNITTSDITIAGAQTTGILNIGTGARTTPVADSAINIGTSAVGATRVNIGTAAYTDINLNGTSVDVSTKITSPAYDSSAANTNMTFGANLVKGDLIIAEDQTEGLLNIACNAGRLAAGEINICTTNQTNSLIIPIKIGNSTSLTTIQGNCSITNELATPGGIKSTGNITTSGTATITALSTGSLIGPYKNAATATASITTAGQITGTSLVLASGAVGCGTITSTGNISTSSASGTITAPSGGFLIGPYKNAATATASITAAGAISGTSLSLTNPITLPTTAVTPTSAQLGYYTTGGVGFTSVSYFAAFPSGTALGSISSIPIGRYLLLTSYAADTFTNIGTYFRLYVNMTNGTIESMMDVSLGQSGATGGKTTGDVNGFVTITATSGTIAMVGRTEASGTSVNVYITMRLIRIA